MNQNSNQSKSTKDEIVFFVEIINKLIASKKLIIATTFVCALSAFLYSFQSESKFQSTAFIEISHKNIDDARGANKVVLIERADDLKYNLEVNLYYMDNLIVPGFIEIDTPKGDKILKITSTSNSIETNNISINQIVEYIIDRHKDILNKSIDQLTYTINNLNVEIQNIILSEINELNMLIPIVNKKISSLQKVIHEDENNLKLLEANTELSVERAAVYRTMNQIIHNYKMTLLGQEDEKGRLEAKLSDLNSYTKGSKIINSVNPGMVDLVSSFVQQKNTLEKQLELVRRQAQNNTRVIGSIETRVIYQYNKLKNTIMGFVVGLFLSIFIVIITEPFQVFLKVFTTSQKNTSK
jgi:hypothetical protein